jgi:hypothetical protein
MKARFLTAERMLAIEASSVIDGDVDVDGNLILATRGGGTINAGRVKGDKGDPGDNVDAKAYSDAGDATTLASAKTYTDTGVTSAKTYTDGLVKAKSISGAVDLNTYMTPGVYAVNLTADAIAGTNYPAPATAGILQVDVAPTGDYIYQRFIPYGPYANQIFVRARYNATWYPWSSTTGPQYAIQFGTGSAATGTVAALGYASTPLSSTLGYTRATNRITVPAAGTYLISYRFKWSAAVGTGRCFVELTLGATTQHQYSIPTATALLARQNFGPSEDQGSLTIPAALTAGAQIGGNAYQSSGGALGIDGLLTIQRTA